MNILIAGYGFVGQAHEKLLQEQHNVMIYDPAQGYNDFPDDLVEAMIICVSTRKTPFSLNIDGRSIFNETYLFICSDKDIKDSKSELIMEL